MKIKVYQINSERDTENYAFLNHQQMSDLSGQPIKVHETEGEGRYKTQRIVIFYRFVGYIEIPEIALNQGIIKDTRQGVSVSYIPKAITA